jgi:RNA polymerase sigma-70 factor (ECF subfamily)
VRFGETLWSTVFKAREPARTTGRDAFGRLAATYWKPVYFFVRRRGRSVEDAKDLTQGFFASLLEREALKSADPRRGRFRTFLLTILERYLANEAERASAKKRGGGRIPVDLRQAERELRTSDSPATAFERAWGAGVLARAFERMRQEPRFDLFEAAMSRGLSPAEICRASGLGAKEVENALYRARKRYRELVLEEILQDVETREEGEAELRGLLERMR